MKKLLLLSFLFFIKENISQVNTDINDWSFREGMFQRVLSIEKLLSKSNSDSLTYTSINKQEIVEIGLILNTNEPIQLQLADKAMELLDSILLYKKSDLPNVWFHKGIFYNRLNRSKEAIDCFERVAKINKHKEKDYIIPYNIGCIYLSDEQYKNALVKFREAYKLNNANIGNIYNTADCYRKLGKANAAIRWYQKVLMIDSMNHDVYYRIGVVYGRDKNKLDSAIYYISKAIQIDSSTAIYYEDLGVAYGLKADYENAVNMFVKSYSLSKIEKVLNDIITTYDKLNDPQNAMKYRLLLINTTEPDK